MALLLLGGVLHQIKSNYFESAFSPKWGCELAQTSNKTIKLSLAPIAFPSPTQLLQNATSASVQGAKRMEWEDHTPRHTHRKASRHTHHHRQGDSKTAPPPPSLEGVGQKEQLQDVMRRLQKLEELGHAKILSMFSVGMMTRSTPRPSVAGVDGGFNSQPSLYVGYCTQCLVTAFHQCSNG